MEQPTEEVMELLDTYVENLKWLKANGIDWSNVNEDEMDMLDNYVQNLKYIENQ